MPRNYEIQGEIKEMKTYWCLPPVERFNHEKGVTPYNGIVSVVENCRVIDDYELNSDAIRKLCQQREYAADLVKGRAPIRIDYRQDQNGEFFLFDLNMKPNITGPSRGHRANQTCLQEYRPKRLVGRIAICC